MADFELTGAEHPAGELRLQAIGQVLRIGFLLLFHPEQMPKLIYPAPQSADDHRQEENAGNGHNEGNEVRFHIRRF